MTNAQEMKTKRFQLATATHVCLLVSYLKSGVLKITFVGKNRFECVIICARSWENNPTYEIFSNSIGHHFENFYLILPVDLDF